MSKNLMMTMTMVCTLAGCLDPRSEGARPEPTASTTEQLLCTIQDQAAGNCPGQEGCTPLDYCTDANMQDGSCCIRYGHPANPVLKNATCGTSGVGTPFCVRTNSYDFGLISIDCTTVTYWVTGPGGNVTQQSYTDCYLT